MRSATTSKRSARTALAGTHNPVDADHRAGAGPFPKPRALNLHMVKFGQSRPEGHGYIDTADSDLMHHQYRLSLLQWNPGPARRNPTDIVSAACGEFHAGILQEASDLVPYVSDQFLVCARNTDLAILLNKDTFESDPIVLTYKEDSASKGTWDMVLLIVRGLLRRPSLSGTPTVTFCSVHIHSVVARMWGLGALAESNRESTGFLIMPKRPHERRVDTHGCYKIDNATLGLGPRDQTAHFLVFFHLRTTNLPGPSSIMRSEQAQQRRMERRHHKHDRTRRRRT